MIGFEKLTEKMIKDIEKKINKAHQSEDWGRVLTLEGFKSGLLQAIANYKVTKKGEKDG